MLLTIARKSLMNRRGTASLTILSIAFSAFVLLAVEHLRFEVRQSFGRAVSGAELIAGARTGQLHLLMASVFRIGDLTNNLEWSSYEKIAAQPEVKWSIPIALGDSHKGYRVMGTTDEYFEHFKYANKKDIQLQSGEYFSDDRYDQVVLGYEVAKKLNYVLGDELVVAHGTGSTSFMKHTGNPVKVTGILRATGTPIDKTLFVSLETIEKMHAPHDASSSHSDHSEHDHSKHDHDEADHSEHYHAKHDHDKADHSEHDHAKHDHDKAHHSEHDHSKHDHDKADHSKHDHAKHDQDEADHSEHDHGDHEGHAHLEPNQISAFILGLNRKIDVLSMQRKINEFQPEALTSIIPGVALKQLWDMLGGVETILRIISRLVLFAAMIGLCTMLLAAVKERKREIAIFRVLGASPLFIVIVVMAEALLITLVAFALALLVAIVGFAALSDLIVEKYGIFVEPNFLSMQTLELGLLLLAAGLLVSLLPAWSAYRHSLGERMTG